jgi:hypothetical protein
MQKQNAKANANANAKAKAKANANAKAKAKAKAKASANAKQLRKQRQMRGFFASLRMTSWVDGLGCRVDFFVELCLAAVEEAGGEEDDGHH